MVARYWTSSLLVDFPSTMRISLKRRLMALVVLTVLMVSVGMLLTRNLQQDRRSLVLFPIETSASASQVLFKKEMKRYVNIMPTSERKIKTKPLCRSLPEYVNSHKEIELDSRVLNGVATMLLFIGYARSGHTLIGSLLDAHPNIVVANEYNVLERWLNFTRESRKKRHLLQQLYLNSYNEANKGDRSREDCIFKTKYNYLVPNQWQGKFNETIKVFGDKKGGKTATLLQRSSVYWSVLKEIREEVKVPIKFIHVVRNPFDNLATQILRVRLPVDYNRQLLLKNPLKLPKALQISRVKYYMRIAEGNQRLIQRFGKNVLTVKSEEVIKNPSKQLLRICKFLNVSCPDAYLKDCGSIVYNKPSKTRNMIGWDDMAKKIILENIKRIPFFRHYTFDK